MAGSVEIKLLEGRVYMEHLAKDKHLGNGVGRRMREPILKIGGHTKITHYVKATYCH